LALYPIAALEVSVLIVSHPDVGEIPVVSPRVGRMIAHLVANQAQIERVDRGSLTFDFAGKVLSHSLTSKGDCSAGRLSALLAGKGR
jgi:hypothetical protein